jgi:hypothetical protein
MRQLLRVLLAIIYVTTTFTVLVGQTEAAGEQLGNARSSASPIQPQTDAHWATDPHFSHAKKTGSDADLSTPPSLPFAITCSQFFQDALSSEPHTIQHPRQSRAPPFRF